MAVADFFDGFSPTVPSPAQTKSVALGQQESAAYSRLQENEKRLFDDIRDDVDQAFQRGLSHGYQDPDRVGALVGISKVTGGPVEADDALDEITIVGFFKAEPGSVAPVQATLTVGSGNSQNVFTARNPGNGSQQVPRGEGILLFYDDNDLEDQVLSIENAIITIDGRNYLAIVVHLAVSTGAVTTTAENMKDACDPADVAYNAAIGAYLSATNGGGNGTGLVAGFTEPKQLAGGSGGLYEVFANGSRAVPKSWNPTTSTIVAYVDGTALAADNVVNLSVLANGHLSTASVGVVSGT